MTPSIQISDDNRTLPKELHEELGAAVKGGVYPRSDANFFDYSKMFNGNVKTLAMAVVCPLDAEDVSRVIQFCSKHGLIPSVKAGGYGTAGWAIGGDIIIDVSKIVEVDIEPPLHDGGYTSLRDTAPSGSKGKGKAGSSSADASTSGKRRREDDDGLRTYDSASKNVAAFMKGPPLPSENPDGPSPSVRRRLNNEPESDVPSTTAPLSDSTSLARPTVDLPRRSAPAPSSLSTQSPLAAVPASRQMSTESSTSSSQSTAEYEFSTDRSRTQSSSTSQSETSTNNTSPSPPSMDPSEKYTAPHLAMSSSNPSNPYVFPNASSQTLYQPPGLSQSMMMQLGPSTSALYSGSMLVASPYARLTTSKPIHQHAYVTFGAGMRQKEIDQYTAQHPLEGTSLSGQASHIPYHVPFAAHPVGSSIMILTGFGFQSRLRGLSIDNLVEAEMVLADGRIVIVNEQENPELWWAIRGAGPAFGVVTRYKAKAFPLPVVFAGNLIYRFHRATAPSLIKHFRDCIKGAPRELYANVLLTAGPAGKDSLVVIQLCYLGPKEEGQEYLQAISSWDGERCLLNEVNEKSFLNQQDSVAQVLRGKAGRQWFIRSALVTSLPDDVIHKTVMEFSTGPVGCTWLFELAGGAVADTEDNCLPKSQREAAFNVAALHQWELDNHDHRCISSAEDWIYSTLTPVSTGGPYPAFLGRHEPPSRTIGSYGENWPRLTELRRKYDPTGMFKSTFWPLDNDGNTIEPQLHEPPTP